MARKAIGKTLRFEVFKRDLFTCQYCGAHPPNVVLEIDHIKPVSAGGGNAENNLVTACYACNRGKAARSLSDVPQSLADKAKQTKEAEAQLEGYQSIMMAQVDRIERDTWQAIEAFEGGPEESYSKRKFASFRRFVELLGLHGVIEAVHQVETKRLYGERRFLYFCGVCWGKIRSAENAV